jgi:aminoglycoside phosphotransferase family enzyme/predicted kinase
MNRTRTAAKTNAALRRQEQLLPFLINPNSYPHRPSRVRLVQTHSSFVFIAPPFVFKLKKPVNFGFLDFSTLEKRRYFCEREVELNRRLCPKVYLGVLPISRLRGRFSFGGEGRVVEYAVKMRKLSERHFLDRLVERGEAVPGDLDRIAIALREFYLAQHPSEEIEAWGRIDRLRISTDENFRQTRKFIGNTLSRPAFATIRFYTNAFYRRHGHLFASRVRGKWIRDCHGDLHLEHIHLTSRALHIYDCIEFNDRFRYVDVANDAAFLAMDLDYEDRPDLARHFATTLAAALKDGDMPRLMNFYKCYRADVRGKVESLHRIAPAVPEAERQESAGRAQRYFRLALRYAVAGSEPLVLAVMGRIGAGKSTLARALGAELGWSVLSSDRARKELAGFPLYERSGAAVRRQLYSKAMTKKTYQHLLAAAEREVRAGRSVIIDATFAQREHRAALMHRFRSQPAAFLFLEAQAADPTVKERLKAREARAGEVSDARLEDFEMLTRLYEAPTELSARHRIEVRTAAPLEKTLTGALQALARIQVEHPCPLH